MSSISCSRFCFSYAIIFLFLSFPITAFETEPGQAQSSRIIALVLHLYYHSAEVPSPKWNSLWFSGERSYWSSEFLKVRSHQSYVAGQPMEGHP